MEEQVIAQLLNDQAVSAIVGSRVFPGRRIQAGDLPAVVFQVISQMPGYDDQGEIGLTDSRIQIDCWAATYTEAKELSRAVTELFSGAFFDAGGTEFQYTQLNGARDLPESGSNAADYFYRVMLDFSLLHSPSP